MIPKPVLTAWRKVANWPLDDQVEQDLILSRALVELFNDSVLRDKIAFRGGTALHKLVFPEALRYSEDIDLNRLEKGPVKPIIEAVRLALNDALGRPKKVKTTLNSVKIIYDYDSIAGGTRRLKIEINVRETLPLMPLIEIPFEVKSDYFNGSTVIKAYDREEMVGTKIRALYQRSKGRDLFDLYEASKLDLDWSKTVDSYLALNVGVTQAQYRKNLELKMKNPEFLEDINPLLLSNLEYDPQAAFDWFVENVLPKV